MFEIEKNDEINRLIEITKSDSGVSGPELAKAHIQLGTLLAKNIDVDPTETTIVAILRGGLFFAMGMYFELGCKFEVFDPKHEDFQRPSTDNVIIVDSVINTGKTIEKILSDDMLVACCVINEKAVSLFGDQLFTIRVSTNSFVGSNIKKQEGRVGPDTTMRLFNQL